MTYTEFIYKHNGYYREYNQDQFKNQCMDLFWLYLKEVLNIDPAPYQGWGSAKNCYLNFNNIKGAKTRFKRINNGPYDVPEKGDIIFWGMYPGVTGFAGHVAIFDHGDVWTFVSFDQNYPTGSPCHFVKHGINKYFHGYRGVMGWWRPIK